MNEATTCSQGEGREAGHVNLEEGAWGLGPVWIGDLGVVLQGEWGLGPESGVGVWVKRLVPTQRGQDVVDCGEWVVCCWVL